MFPEHIHNSFNLISKNTRSTLQLVAGTDFFVLIDSFGWPREHSLPPSQTGPPILKFVSLTCPRKWRHHHQTHLRKKSPSPSKIPPSLSKYIIQRHRRRSRRVLHRFLARLLSIRKDLVPRQIFRSTITPMQELPNGSHPNESPWTTYRKTSKIRNSLCLDPGKKLLTKPLYSRTQRIPRIPNRFQRIHLISPKTFSALKLHPPIHIHNS